MKRHGLFALIVAFALTASACSSPGGDTNSGTSSDGGEPQSGGTILTVQRYVLPGGLNFLTNGDPGLPGEISPSYSKLVDFATGTDTVGTEIAPDLADSWEISDDGTVYTFHLNEDATFHDVPPVDGREVTADDVVATFDAIIELKASTAYQFAAVTDITAVDEHTVQITLSEPQVQFLENMAMPGNFIAPEEGVRGDYDMDKVLIGSGPFQLIDYDPATLWHREKHDGYFREGLPYADAMDTLIVPDAAARYAALRSGRLLLADVALKDQADALVKTGDFQSVAQMTGPEMIYLNPEIEPLGDVRVRRAIALAIDWDGMGKSIRGVYGLTSVVPPELGGISADELREIRPYDPEEAKKLLAEAGVTEPIELSMVVQQVDGKDVSEAEWIVEDLKAVGIDVKLELVDPATYANRRASAQFEMARGLRTLLSADQYMSELASTSGTNFTHVDDPHLDELIAQSRSETDPDARAEIIAEFTRYFETDVATVIAGPMTYDLFVWSNSLHNPYTSGDGISPYVIRYGQMLGEIWIEQ